MAERPPQFKEYAERRAAADREQALATQVRSWIYEQLALGRSESVISDALVTAGVSDEEKARRLVAQFAETRRAALQEAAIETRQDNVSRALLYGLVGIVLMLWIGYNNVQAFDSGRDGCVWGPPTETQCGFQISGTAKGKVFGHIMYGPGYFVGKLFASDDH